jgi:hypothetical protein
MPNADRARIPEGKLNLYLLSSIHPVGRSKAAFFRKLGFDPPEPGVLADALLALATAGRVVSIEASAFGVKYAIEGTIWSPAGRSARVRSIWMVAIGNQVPVLVTAFPSRGGVK